MTPAKYKGLAFPDIQQLAFADTDCQLITGCSSTGLVAVWTIRWVTIVACDSHGELAQKRKVALHHQEVAQLALDSIMQDACCQNVPRHRRICMQDGFLHNRT